MLMYELQKVINGVMHYAYYPEKTGSPGIVAIDCHTGEGDVIKVSNDDIGSRYAYKLIARLERLYAQNALDNDGIIAWY